MTIQEALQEAKRRLHPLETATLEAQLFLSHVLEMPRVRLIAYPEHPLNEAQQLHFNALITRRERGEPYAYIMGKQAFFDSELIVSPDVLIPRPETEHLVEEALSFINQQTAPLVADIGTGSGAIITTIARHAPHAVCYATDISPNALSIARQNAQSLPITFYEGGLAHPLIENGVRVAVLLANLPYIPTEECNRLPVSRYEPRLALDGGADGLVLIQALLQQVPDCCTPNALILLEIGAGQGTTVQQYAEQCFPCTTRLIYDYAGHDRIVRIQRH